MGCVHGKCCSRYPASSDADPHDLREVVAPHMGNDGNHHVQQGNNHQYVLTERALELVDVPSHEFHLEYSVLSQRGYYPDSPEKENQDSFCITTKLQGNPNLHFFGVFDGHGQFGTQCSSFVKDRLVEVIVNDHTLCEDPVKAYEYAFITTNSELHDSDIDDGMSGTTAITVLVRGDTLFVANVGDSRAVIAVKNGDCVVAHDLSDDQTPFRKDECERVKQCGARVLSVDQVEGLKDPDIQSWGDEESDGGDPPRLWVKNGMYPGTAFTRSVGDSTAEKIGVIAVPEISVVQLTQNHLFFVVASDGVFEFLSSQAVVDMVVRYSDPRDACAAIAGESYKLWLEHENRTDDITIIVVHIRDLRNSGSGITDGGRLNIKGSAVVKGKVTSNASASAGSEVYQSMMSGFSEHQPFELSVASRRSPLSILPSPTYSRSLEMVT
ncbi:hypothetical protein Scep_030516 [Stephania cephalantha]|uniref:protein-serine/threonine phosphatase n=1 Tax=Stephania cephalantha TaxID=152367 RepID=A0AAP0HIP3_9MAGN